MRPYRWKLAGQLNIRQVLGTDPIFNNITSARLKAYTIRMLREENTTRVVNTALHKKRHRITRAVFERMLSGMDSHGDVYGIFVPVIGKPGRRINGHWETYKDWSRLVPERRDCFIKNLKRHTTKSARTWDALAVDIGLSSPRSGASTR